MISAIVPSGSRAPLTLATLTALTLATWALPAIAAPPNVGGKWSEVVVWPRIPVHMALLPDGKIATFGATPQNGQGGLDVDIWNPKLGLGTDAHLTLPNGINVDTFCSGLVLAPWSGELVTVGGATGDDDSTLKAQRFSYKTRTLAAIEPVKYPRWYSTMTTLPDGRLIVNGGVVPYLDSASASTTAEIYTPGQGWRTLTGTTQARQTAADTERRYWYPHVFAAANNKVFVIAGKRMYRIGYNGNGSVGEFQPFAGPNWGGTSTAVLFAPKKVLQFGGGWTANDDEAAPAGSKNATIVDFSTYPYKVTETGAMTLGRHWGTGTLLPTGEVLATGGAEGNNSATNVAYAAEIWNPNTGGWRLGASMKLPRLYHSAALLLPDGRILSGGGGAPGPIVGNNVEIYSPPYLFAADGSPAPRPAINSEPGTVRLGQTVQVQVSGGRPIARFTMVKTGAVTHGFNTDQRFLEVPFARTGDGYALRITADPVDATPGYYLLFALDDTGVPSIAKMIRIPSPVADNGDTPPTGQNGETAGVGAAPGNTGGGQTASNNGGNNGGGGNTGGGNTGTPVDGTSAPLVAAHSSMCLSVEGGSAADGARVVQETCNGSALQTWTWRAGNGGSMLVNTQTNKCLDVFNGRTEDGAALVQWPCWGGDMQVWKSAPLANGLALFSKLSNKCVDVAAISTQSGAQVYQWTCNGQDNQAWRVPTAPAPTPTDDGTVAGISIGVDATRVASAGDGTTLVINRTTGVVWRYNADNNWTALGNRAMREVATGGANRLFAIGTDGVVYRWNTTDWVRIGFGARSIAAASDGTVVITNETNDIWIKIGDDFREAWAPAVGKGLKVVAVAANRFWAIGVDGNVYRSGGNETWVQAGVNVSDIAAASDGGIAVINKDTGETWRKANEDAPWARSGEKALQLAAQRSNLWITVGQNNAVYRIQVN